MSPVCAMANVKLETALLYYPGNSIFSIFPQCYSVRGEMKSQGKSKQSDLVFLMASPCNTTKSAAMVAKIGIFKMESGWRMNSRRNNMGNVWEKSNVTQSN